MVFTKVLIANRGEVALRINSTLQKMGIEAIGVHTHHDRASLHVQHIARNYLLNESGGSGYLEGEQMIAIALESGCQAIHPGYGFLSESASFAKACAEAGIIFIGPTASAIAAVGEKISARQFAIKAGVPVVPGTTGNQMSNEELLDACKDFEFPLLVKPSAGGGGKGLHVARDMESLREVLPIARREARAAFGDETLLVEKYLLRARHIEFQVAADNFGNVIHLGERECSLQRRHQKIVEEAPAPAFSEKNRNIMGDAAISLCKTIEYNNIGTVEFLVDADSPETFYFMEMNTRLQVEHRVTEMITGIDLVECQLRLAAGEELGHVIPSPNFSGHAIEARVYAEDPSSGFLPTGGLVGKFAATSAESTITDTAITDGVFVSSAFDPMLAKVASWGKDRNEAISHLQTALASTVVLGVATNIDFLIDLLGTSEIRNGHYDTKYIETLTVNRPKPSSEVLSAYSALVTRNSKVGPWRSDGWRMRGANPATIVAYVDGQRYEVPTESSSSLHVDTYREDDSYWLHHPSFGTWHIKENTDRGAALDPLSGEIVSPMPGAVVALHVEIDDHVSIGDPLVVIEAMKMEHIVRARRTGRVSKCHIQLGSSVHVGQLLIEVVEDV